MSQESIKDFVKIPGVLGVALTQESQLYFYPKERLAEKERQILILNILQVIENPKKLKSHELRIMGYYMYSYELNSSVTFLVITETDISAIKLRPLAARQLKDTLQRNIDHSLLTFKVLTNKFSQPQAASIKIEAQIEEHSIEESFENILESSVTVEQLINALNRISRFSSNYIGNKLTANYWQLTRPESEWLDNFRINRSAEIVFTGIVAETVSSLQHQLIKDWATAFINYCSQIITNMPTMLEQKSFDERERNILLTPPNNY